MFVNSDVLYTELLNSGNTQYCFPFLNIVIPSKTNNSKWLLDKNINDQIRS